MILVRATPAHAAAMALIHSAAFPPDVRWVTEDMALQLTLPGAYGFVSLPSFVLEEGWGEGASAAERGTSSAAGQWAERAGDGACPLSRPCSLPEREGEVSGGLILARVAADEAEVLTLAVTPPTRNRGLGRQLLRAAQDHARAYGAVSMFLEVSPMNAPALALYAGAGFLPVGRRPRYYPSGGDALVLRCSLIPGAAAAGASRPAGA